MKRNDVMAERVRNLEHECFEITLAYKSLQGQIDILNARIERLLAASPQPLPVVEFTTYG